MRQQTVTEYAREHGITYLYRAALDNHTPARREARGELFTYTKPTTTNGILLLDRSQFRDNEQAIFLIDNGSDVKPYHSASWHPDHEHLVLHQFPLSQGIRPDNGRPIDMRNWMLGPRRCYHLKITLRVTCPCGMAWADEPGHADHAPVNH